MANQHSLTPPPELVGQWLTEAADLQLLTPSNLTHLATKAAQWGADQELEECVEWLGDAPVVIYDNVDLHPGSYLRDARRPKPPSLKEHALETLHSMQIEPCMINGVNTIADLMAKYDILRRALEALPND